MSAPSASAPSTHTFLHDQNTPQRPTHRRIAQAHSGAEFDIPQPYRTSLASSSKPHNVNAHYTVDIVTSLRVVDTCAIHRALSESFQQSVHFLPSYRPPPRSLCLSSDRLSTSPVTFLLYRYHRVQNGCSFPQPRPLAPSALSCSSFWTSTSLLAGRDRR